MKKEMILKQAKYMLQGFLRVLHGAATAVLLVLAVVGFASVAGDGGYLAVGEFLLAVATLGFSLANVYWQGKGWKRKGH